MIRFVSVVLIVFFGCGLAAKGLPNPAPANCQAIQQTAEQSESGRLSSTIADLYKQGKYDEALPLAKRVLEIERGLGPERLEVATALVNLGELYFAKKKFGDAENPFQQAAAIYEKQQINSAALSDVLERLAQISFTKQKYDNAVILLGRSLAIREKSYGAESIQVAETLHEQANVYQMDHQSQKAESLYLRAITTEEKLLGRTNPDTVQAMKDFACLRVKNLPARVVKQESKTEPTAAEIERQAVIERASCWLFGFKQDCDKEPDNPGLKFSTVLNGKAIKLVQPPYPQAAKAKRISGTVYVAVLIDGEGTVIKAKPLCGGYPELNGPAVNAALASQFSPTKLDDRPIEVSGMIVYRFVAQ